MLTLTVKNGDDVAPRVGAWIETLAFDVVPKFLMSRPAWARGLKPFLGVKHFDVARRAPRGRVD